MKKILFNDKYGLTRAVLEGRKTQTRRIAYCGEIKNVRFGYGLEGKEEDKCFLLDGWMQVAESRYSVGELVAVAQCYSKIMDYYHSLGKVSERKVSEQELIFWNAMRIMESTGDDSAMRGDDNKMFVKADLMPHHIKMTNIRIERLQDISDDDCFKEGVYHDSADGAGLNWISCKDMKAQNELLRHEWHGKKGLWFWDTPQKAYAALIDRISGKGTWEKNPWVFVYDFELVD